MNEAWLEHPVVRSVLDRLIDRIDSKPLSERSRAPGFRITAESIPELFSAPAPGEDDFAWSLIEKLRDRGYLEIRSGRSRPGTPPWELEPYLRLNPAAEAEVRSVLGRTERAPSEYERWREALSKIAPHFQGSVERFAAQPLHVPGRTPEEVAQRLIELPTLARGRSFYLREASARLFWGLSKLLDNRADAIAALLGESICPFPEKPVSLHIQFPAGSADGVLFVENETAFAALCERRVSATRSLVLVYAAGFKTAAKRMRLPGGAICYFREAHGNGNGLTIFQAWLRGDSRLPSYWWGDLDYSGMGILKALREGFADLTAWGPGYARMVEAVRQGFGHPPVAGDKEGQSDPERTGCVYADTELLPLIRSSGLFLDQEYVVWDE